MDTISAKEQVEKKIGQLEVLTNRNLADLSVVSESSLDTYFSWIIPKVYRQCKEVDCLARFYNLYKMNNVSKQKFISELTNLYIKGAKESKNSTDLVRYFQFVSENGTLDIRKDLGKLLSKLSKKQMTELDASIREYYSRNKRIISHWEEVKEIDNSANPILSNLANMFHRKKKED